ncbi:MAG: hypothetical protein ACPG2Y_03250, partial [Acholeplasmataceae bacterium]
DGAVAESDAKMIKYDPDLLSITDTSVGVVVVDIVALVESIIHYKLTQLLNQKMDNHSHRYRNRHDESEGCL